VWPLSLVDQITKKLLQNITPSLLELGSSTIKIFKAKPVNNLIKIETCSLLDSPETTSFSPDSDAYAVDCSEFAESLKKLFPVRFFQENYVSLIIPDQAFFFGSFSVPTVAVKTGIQPLLEREVKNVSSLSFSECRVHYEFGPRQGNKVQVFFCAIPEKTLVDIKEACAAGNVIPVSLQPSFVGLVKLLKISQRDSKYPTVFLHLGHEKVTAGIVKGEGLMQIQVIDLGMKVFIDRLSQDLNIAPEEAIQKIKDGLILLDDPSSDAQLEIPEYAILESLFADLLQKVYGFLLLYSNDHTEDSGFAKIILSGGGARMKNLDRLIAANLGVTTSLLSNEIENLVNASDFDNISNLEAIAPLLGHSMIRPWKEDAFERIFAQ
jgi:Tfp pilus assembly PilM family ATPase